MILLAIVGFAILYYISTVAMWTMGSYLKLHSTNYPHIAIFSKFIPLYSEHYLKKSQSQRGWLLDFNYLMLLYFELRQAVINASYLKMGDYKL